MVVTGARELEIYWLTEREESKTKPTLSADEQGRIGLAGRRKREGE